MRFLRFKDAISGAQNRLYSAPLVHTATWQGVDISNKPEMATYEILNYSFTVEPVPYLWAEDVKPNLPWAENHFQERVCGKPINPGIEWKNWPWGHSAEKFLDGRGQFNHNYMERYWPKYAGKSLIATQLPDDFKEGIYYQSEYPNHGIRYTWGDLNDILSLLVDDPHTRQAYLPVWFPEDTGGGNKRAPCSLGYQFIMRNGIFHCVYFIRSCDYLRHFRDDIYLTVRLQEWVLDKCKSLNQFWKSVEMGSFTMHITSLHLFRNDYIEMFKNGRP